MPEVSVVFPCFNAAEHLPRAIDSVRAQSQSDIELIVVDDGSSESATLDYLASLPDDVLVVRQENKGLPAARNAGFKAASGKYIMPLDCDDFLDPRCIEEFLDVVRSDDGVSYAFSHIALCGEKSGILKRNFNFFEQLFLNHVPYCILISKDIWREVGGYDERMCNGLEDWEFNLRLGINGHYGGLVDKPLFFYFVRSAGMLQSITNRRHAQLSQFIRKEHPEYYGFRSLKNIWREWRGKPSTYPLMSYFGLIFMYGVFPYWLFNPTFRLLMTFSNSRRIQKFRTADLR